MTTGTGEVRELPAKEIDIYTDSREILSFFSSRRRHTRCLSDWSSDVCSYDLTDPKYRDEVVRMADYRQGTAVLDGMRRLIGRASCRERVYIPVVAVSLKKK